jgi:two-component system sensor histidine kinase VicK
VVIHLVKAQVHKNVYNRGIIGNLPDVIDELLMSDTPQTMTSDNIPLENSPRFISWRWRTLLPLWLVITLVTMIGAYFVAFALSDNLIATEENVLLLNAETVTERSASLHEDLLSEARRVAFTVGVAEAIVANQVTTLHTTLEGIAVAGNLDSIIVTGATGIEVAGLLRVTTSDFTDYSLATGTVLDDAPFLQTLPATANSTENASIILRTSQGLVLYVGQPIFNDETAVGFVLVGQYLDTLLEEMQASAVADLSLYANDGALLQTTFSLEDVSAQSLTLSTSLRDQTLNNRERVLSHIALNEASYRLLTMPFDFGGQTLGIVAVAQPDNVAFATFSGRQASSMFVAVLAGAVVSVVIVALSQLLGRVETVTETVDALSQGERKSRTGLQPVDEVSQLGHAIDQYVDSVQEQEDRLRTMLRRQRRERNYFFSVLESIPEGIIVQDENSRLIVMNAQARELLNQHETSDTIALEDTPLDALQHVVDEQLGQSIAPGVYTLGNPLSVEYEGKVLSAQAAAVLSPTQKRLGTVIILRDMTDFVRQSKARDDLLEKLSADIQEPLAQFARENATHPDPLVDNFAREIAKHAASLQKMIVDMRELTRYSRMTARQRQRVIAVETLIWAVANDWRQIAQAAGIAMDVEIRKTGLFVLGDESRLRYALGNIVDNALKYTPTGGRISLEVKDEVEGAVHLRVRDNGVGISDQDYAYLFTSFYRGTPVTQQGQVIRVPGMGLGLPEAQRIVTAHGGVMRVKTRLNVGTAVYFALPLTSGVSYQLPTLTDDDMEGDTVVIPDNVDIESYWRE